MTWLQPWAWLGLGALVVPIVVHLFSRRPARTAAFPSLRFLTATELRPTRRSRLSDWRLLLVRLAILLAAVLALAQPTRRAALVTADAVSRVRVVDTLSVASDAVPRDSADTFATDALPDGLARAVARLSSMPAPRQLEVISTFAAGVADSAMFASVPRDVRLTLTPAFPRGRAAETRADTLWWQSTLSPAEQATVVRAVSALGGPPVVAISRPAEGAMALQEIVIPRIMISGTQGERSIFAAERVRRMAHDPALPALIGRAERVRVRLAGDTLTFAVASARADVALALLLAVGGAAAELPAGAPRDSLTVARWQQAPAGPAIGAGTVVTDVHQVLTEARWAWVVVLVLLAVEWVMRRRAPVARETPA